MQRFALFRRQNRSSVILFFLALGISVGSQYQAFQSLQSCLALYDCDIAK